MYVGNAVVEIDDDLALGVVVHGIDAEVAPCGIILLAAPDVVAQQAARGVYGVLHAFQSAAAGFFVAADLFGAGSIQVGAKGGDFDDFVFAPAPIHHMHNAKAPPDDEGAAKEVFDLLGGGVGGYVKVFWGKTYEQIAHCAAYDVGIKACLLEGAYYVCGAFIHQLGVDAVDTGGYFGAFARGS